MEISTSEHGNIDKLVQIQNVYGSVHFHSPVVLDKLDEAVIAQRSADDSKLMRQSAARVLSLLRSRNALYADLDDEVWEHVFISLRELRDAFSQAAAELTVDGPESIQKLLDLMIEATREYLAAHQARYLHFMQSVPAGQSPLYADREWPGRRRAAEDLLWLRTILVAAIQPLNSYAQRGEEVPWRDDLTMLRRQQSKVDQAGPGVTEGRPPSLSALRESLDSDSELVRLTAVRQAAEVSGTGALTLLMGVLRDDSSRVREIALQALRDRKSLLDDETKRALTEMGHREFHPNALPPGRHSLPVLIAALRGPDADRALIELSRTGDPRAVRPILDLAPAWQWPTLLDKIYAALMRLGPVAVPEYEHALRVDEAPVRRVAAEMLAIAATPELLPSLERAAADPSETVRQSLVRGLLIRKEDPGDPSRWLLPMLEELVADPDPRVRKEAAQVVERLTR